jgi:hypothetical protein
MIERKGITAAQLIDALEKLPRDTLIFGFDVEIGERATIHPKTPIDFWDQENGHADINFYTEDAPPFDPIKNGSKQI